MRRFIYFLCVLALSLSAHAAGTLAEVTPEEIYLTANVGDTVTATITITNISSQSISPSASLTSDDGYFWIDDINDDIPPAPGNNVREIIVTYSPDQAGYHYAYLSLYINDEFYYVEIAGEAIGQQTPRPTITVASVSDYNDPKYMITIENDESVPDADIFFSISMDGEMASEYMIYSAPFMITDCGYYTITAFSQAEGMLPSEYVVETIAISPPTGYDTTSYALYDFYQDGIYYMITSDSTVSVCRDKYNRMDEYYDLGSPYSGDVSIPATVTHEGKTYTVTGIDKYTFFLSSMTSISLPSTIETIGVSAFEYYPLSEIDLPASLLEMGSGSFRFSTNLTHITIPDRVESIESSTFEFCESLSSVVIGKSVKAIGRGTFADCPKLVSMTVDSDNQWLDSRDGCNAVIETSSNTLILGIQTTVIPTSVTAIGDEAFIDCTGLRSIVIPEGVTTIGDWAFDGCRNMTEIAFQGTMTSIGEWAFASCGKLTQVELPEGIQELSSNLFFQDNLLARVSIPSSVTLINNAAFEYCSSLDSVIIPNTVTSIKRSAFSYCSSLSSIDIPASVIDIESGIFNDCSHLDRIQVDAANPVYDSRNNCNAIINTASNTLMEGSNTTVIPATVTAIGDRAFGGRDGLASIVVPNSVKSIGDFAFFGCDSLRSVDIGASVTSIGYGSFQACARLSSMTCRATVPPVASKSMIYSNSDYVKVVLYVPEQSIDAYRADATWQKFTNIQPIANEPGDVNGDGALDVDDVSGLIGLMLSGGQLPSYADLNGDGLSDIDDVTILITMLLGN